MKHEPARVSGVYVIDGAYLRPQMDAIYLLVEAGRVAIIDTGTASSAPQVLAALEALGLERESVDWILLTHVHLDHAGGAGTLMQSLPLARLVVHPRGTRHMVDPSRLWAGTVAVYGEAFARTTYGALLSVDAHRIVQAQDGMQISLAGRVIDIIDAPGHARHHVCYYDGVARGWFTGDCFGLSYREIHVAGRAFVFPTTTPVQFDPEALHASIERMLDRAPLQMYLTHYSRVREPARLAADLHRLIDAFVAITLSAKNFEENAQQMQIRTGLEALLRKEAATQGWAVQGDAAVALHAEDLDLNAQGLQIWLKGQE